MASGEFSVNPQRDILFNGVFDSLPDFTVIVGESGEIVAANPQALAVSGYTPREIAHRPFDSLIPERYRNGHSRHFRDYLADPQPRPMASGLDLSLLRKDGAELPVEISLSPFATSQGKFIVCVVRDISNRKKIETAFLGDERFRLFMKHTPSAVAMFDSQMRYLAVSNRWLEEYRLENRDILGQSHYEVFPEIPERWKEVHRRCLAGETLAAEEELFLRGNGETDWVSWKMHPWHLDSGVIGGAILFTEIVTSRKQIEQALRESEHRYRDIFETAVTGIAITDLSRRFLMCNPAYCKLLGYTNEELRQLDFVMLLHPDDREANMAVYRSLLSGERTFFEIENRYLTKKQEPVWVHKVVSTLTDDSGKPVLIQVLATDVSERKKHEQALRDSHAFSMSILDSLASHIAVLNQQGVIVAVNKAWNRFARENTAQETAADMLGVNYLDVCVKAFDHPQGEEADAAMAGIRGVLSGNLKTFGLEYPCHSPYQQRWFRMHVTRLQGSIGGVVVSHENITSRKQNEDKLNSIFNAAHEGIISFNPSGAIVSANAAVEAIFGYKPEELLGCNLGKLGLSKQELLSTNRIPGQLQELEGLRKDGAPVPLDISLAAYVIDNQRYFTLIARDIGLRKQRAEQDRIHLAQLAHVTRLGLMGEMASGIAHEINQPLSAISAYTQGFINLLNANNAEPALIAEIAQKTQEQALRAGRIISRMREFIKSGKNQRTTVDVHNLIHEAVSLCSGEIKHKGVELSLVPKPDLPPVFADHIQIEQVIINLIRNSVDALQCLPGDRQRKLSIHTRLTGNREIEVRIKDNGPGMDEAQQGQLFMPFYSSKPDGMGMGLSICRSLIQSHGGELRFNSKAGKGSTFYFTLPACVIQNHEPKSP